jgi:hypothetical protein
MKIFISGPITGIDNYREEFKTRQTFLEAIGYNVMNPAILPYPGFEHHEYMCICKSMIDACDTVYFMSGWDESIGANMEHAYAIENQKKRMYESELLGIDWGTHGTE